MKNQYITGIDIGSSKIAICVGQLSDEQISINALYSAPHSGMRKGVITDPTETTNTLTKILEQAEELIDYPINSAFIGMTGHHITSITSRGVIAVSRADGEISEIDTTRAIEAARTIALPPNLEILHTIPKKFIIDGNDGIIDPIGMKGIRLEVEAHIVSGANSAIRNLSRALNQANLQIDELVFSPLATSKALLDKNQKEMGVLLVDLGASTTSLIVYEEGNVIHCAILPIGSMHITNDIAIGLRTSLETAEKIKIRYASAISEKIKEGEMIDLSEYDPSEEEKVSRKYVAEIIEARLVEIFHLIREELQKIDRDAMLPAGVVYTGGGSNIDGLIDLSKYILKLPSQVGYPNMQLNGEFDKIDNPVYSTSIGLVLWGAEASRYKNYSVIDKNLGGVVDKAKKIFKQILP